MALFREKTETSTFKIKINIHDFSKSKGCKITDGNKQNIVGSSSDKDKILKLSLESSVEVDKEYCEKIILAHDIKWFPFGKTAPKKENSSPLESFSSKLYLKGIRGVTKFKIHLVPESLQQSIGWQKRDSSGQYERISIDLSSFAVLNVQQIKKIITTSKAIKVKLNLSDNISCLTITPQIPIPYFINNMRDLGKICSLKKPNKSSFIDKIASKAISIFDILLHKKLSNFYEMADLAAGRLDLDVRILILTFSSMKVLHAMVENTSRDQLFAGVNAILLNLRKFHLKASVQLDNDRTKKSFSEYVQNIQSQLKACISLRQWFKSSGLPIAGEKAQASLPLVARDEFKENSEVRNIHEIKNFIIVFEWHVLINSYDRELAEPPLETTCKID